MRFGIIHDDSCLMYTSTAETLEHILFDCVFSAQCLTMLSDWLGIQIPLTLERIVRKRWKISKMKRKILVTSICCLCYHIWWARNDAIWHLRLSTPAAVLQRIRQDVTWRIHALYPAFSEGWFRMLSSKSPLYSFILFIRSFPILAYEE